jgi:hypothetical protein
VVVNCQSDLASLLFRSRSQARDFFWEGLLVGDTPVEALFRDNALFAFRHVQQTAMSGRLIPTTPVLQLHLPEKPGSLLSDGESDSGCRSRRGQVHF